MVDAESSKFTARPRPKASRSDEIIIGHDVWIGADVTLKSGITIGTGSVIAASSIVVKDVPPYSVVGGNSAKIIRERFDAATINLLISTEWWNYKFTDFSGMDIEKPREFSASLRSAIKQKRVEKFVPESVCLKGFI